MKTSHIIEYALLALIILVPVFAIVNPISQYRLDRIEAYLNFPDTVQDFTPTDRMMIDAVRDKMLKNAAEKFYEPRGISCFGREYIEREQELFTLLGQLACMPSGTWGLYWEPEVRECDPKIKKDAEALINQTIKNDMNLFDYTAMSFK